MSECKEIGKSKSTDPTGEVKKKWRGTITLRAYTEIPEGQMEEFVRLAKEAVEREFRSSFGPVDATLTIEL